MNKWYNAKTEALIMAILSLQNKDETKAFLRDLMTEAEIIEFGNRWKAAQMLHEKSSYTTITKKTGMSSTTIARISKWLQNGTGGYRLILNRAPYHTIPALAEKGLR